VGLSEVLILVMAVAGFAVGYLAAVLRHGDTKVGAHSASHNSAITPDIVEKSEPAVVESDSFCRYCKKLGTWPKCHDEADLSYQCFVGRRLRDA